MAVKPAREESFTGKEEIDEAQHVPEVFGTDKSRVNEKDEDLDVGAQVCAYLFAQSSQLTPSESQNRL